MVEIFELAVAQMVKWIAYQLQGLNLWFLLSMCRGTLGEDINPLDPSVIVWM